jgi:hypothetical protein
MTFRSTNWIAEGMIDELRNMTDDEDRICGFQFTMRNQFFHGAHPLGRLRAFAIDADGEQQRVDAVTFILRNQRIPSTLIPQMGDIWWQPRESALIEVARNGGLKPGLHTIGFEFQLSTIIFTPVIDRRDVYPAMPGRIEARLPVSGASMERHVA